VSSTLDGALVGAVLLVSVLYASTALGPKRWKAAFWRALAQAAARIPGAPGRDWLSARLAARAARAQLACGGCAGCGSVPAGPAPAGPAPAAAGPTPGGAGAGGTAARSAAADPQRREVRIGLDQIGRRPLNRP